MLPHLPYHAVLEGFLPAFWTMEAATTDSTSQASCLSRYACRSQPPAACLKLCMRPHQLLLGISSCLTALSRTKTATTCFCPGDRLRPHLYKQTQPQTVCMLHPVRTAVGNVPWNPACL